ncbi:Arginine--tRNA ligase [uncultured archaeon]|nr:Arginine--tRNA ligase [uncultured archaeon]
MFLLLKEKLASAIADAAGVSLEEAERSIEMPKGQFGDVASSICFSLAKREKKSPVELARNIAGKIRLTNWVEYAKAEGPYVNFLLSPAYYNELVSEVNGKKSEFGKGKKKKGRTIIEFPSVNPNKPWHIGHLRNAILGDSVARVLEFSGENVERTDYIDDLGLQVAQSFWGYLTMGKKPAGKLDLWLGEEYVEASKRFEADEKVQGEVRALLKEMEKGESKNAKACRKLVEDCVAAQYETAFKFSIYHDVLIFESDIVKTIFAEGLAMLKKNGAIVHETEGKNKGCWVPKMTSPEFASIEAPDKILIRSDGTATFTGKDVIFQLWMFGFLKDDFGYAKFMHQPNAHDCHMSSPEGKPHDFGKASRVVNVIGMEQAYPQKVIREILSNMGYKKEAESSVHLAYEHVGLADAKFSGRQGTWIGYTADELYLEGMKRAEVKIKPEINGAERGAIATAIASAGIRFAFVKTTPEKKIVFNWDIALSLEGDSAPYVIYAHARAHKIFAKAGEGKAAPLQLEQAEKELLKKVMVFDYVVAEAARQMRPHLVAEYCLDLATLYNKFYNVCPVIALEDEKTKANRLAINFAALTVMKNALNLLGIEALETM